MWSGSGGWNQFPIQQSAYANIPAEEVDWASLAKQWIAQRDVMTSSALHDNTSSTSYMSSAVPPPPPPPPPVSTIDQLHQLSANASQPDSGIGGGAMYLHHYDNIVADNCNSQDSTDSGITNLHQPGWDDWGNAGWNVPTWALPPPPPPDEVDDEHSKGHFQLPDSFVPTYEYNQNVSNFYELTNSSGYPYWSVPGDQQMQMPQMIARPPTTEYRPALRRDFVGSTMNVPSLLDDSLLDATKRRQLPAWIREGLEKVEREKLKQMEREKMIQDFQNATKSLETGNDGNKLIGEVLAVKSRFDSDDGDISDNEIKSANPEPVLEPKMEDVPSSNKKEERKVLTEEEKQTQIMMRVRQMLTEVLLEVTGSEIADIAHSVYKSAKTKQARAPAKQLAKSSALASLTSLGLGYDTDTEDEDENDKQGITSPAPDASDSSDEDTFEQRIAQKKKEFERKMSRLEECEPEQVAIRGILPKPKLGGSSVKQENVRDTQVAAVIDNNAEGNIVRDGSEKRRELVNLVTDVTLASNADDNDQTFKRKLKYEHTSGQNNLPVELSSYYKSHTSCKVKQGCSESSRSSSESDLSKKKYASRDQKYRKSITSRESRKHGHSRRKCLTMDKNSDASKQRYSDRCAYISELSDTRLEEHAVSSRRRSSHSSDKDGKKSKKRTSHKRKRTRDTDYSEQYKDKDSSSRHKRRHRSSSSSDHSDNSLSRTKSRRRHQSVDKRHRQRSSSMSREEVRRGSYGKKSRGKRKSKSSSRSTDDC